MPANFSGSATQVSTLADLYEKTNTKVKTGIKLMTEEADWYRAYPKEKITVSGNENRIPLILAQPNVPAAIPDGGYERNFMTVAPVSGTFKPVQLNMRYAFTGLAQALDARSKAVMIENQIDYQATMATYGISRGIGLQFWGSSSGTVAVVKTTAGAAGATQNGIALKNAFGGTLVTGSTTVQNTYLSNLIRVGEQIALIRAGAVVEFGKVTASPSAASGVGYIDAVFNSSITPTVGDLVVFANAITDSTINGTDVNNWTPGWHDIITASSLHGVATSAQPAWAPGYNQAVGGHFSFQVKEAMANSLFNASGVKMDNLILSQGVRRDSISQERGGKRYAGTDDFDLEGDLKKFNYRTSQLALPGCALGYYSQAVSKVDLSDQPEQDGGRSIFKLDKIQDRSAMAASFDYFYATVCSSRGATGIATGLTEA